MRSTAVLGWTALVAIVVAALCFAVVDVTSTASAWCDRADDPCEAPALAPYTGWFAAIGGIALVACIIPSLRWLGLALRARPAQGDDDVRAS